jgi:hypothetical protein
MSENSLRGLLKSIKNKTASLTLYEKSSLIISLFGVFSLVFIVWQTHLTTVNMQASMYATIGTQTLEMDKVFIENPGLRPYFYEDIDIIEEKDKDKEKYNQVMAIAEYKVDLFDSIKTQLGYIPKDKDKNEDRATWDSYFADSFDKSPALCRHIHSHGSWYMQDLKSIADLHCKYVTY